MRVRRINAPKVILDPERQDDLPQTDGCSMPARLACSAMLGDKTVSLRTAK